LELDRSYDRIHWTGEFGNQRVSSTPEDTPMVRFDGLIGESSTSFEIFQRTVLIFSHFFAETYHIGSKDGG
jgi:hypothetical protein